MLRNSVNNSNQATYFDSLSYNSTIGVHFTMLLRLGAQSVALLSTLRDPTQLRQRQCATRQQHPFFVAHQKEGIGQPKKVQHHIGGGQQQKNVRNPLNSRIWVGSIPSF